MVSSQADGHFTGKVSLGAALSACSKSRCCLSNAGKLQTGGNDRVLQIAFSLFPTMHVLLLVALNAYLYTYVYKKLVRLMHRRAICNKTANPDVRTQHDAKGLLLLVITETYKIFEFQHSKIQWLNTKVADSWLCCKDQVLNFHACKKSSYSSCTVSPLLDLQWF